MQFSACITTRNRIQPLNACLSALWNSEVKPFSIIVSDDSSDLAVQQANQQVAQQYPGTTYVTGPQRGVCANRNYALNLALTSPTDLIAFIDDDICIEPTFIANTLNRYQQIPSHQKLHTILSGVHHTEFETNHLCSKLSFRGYFCPSDVPEVVNLHAAVFPRSLLEIEQWDEEIFFGYEDAELCLRALKRGYQIVQCPELRVIDTCAGASTLNETGQTRLTNYEIYIEAARLYVGIKRYKNIFPNRLKLIAFVSLYGVHMTAYLLKRRSIGVWASILRYSHIAKLWNASNTILPTQSRAPTLSSANELLQPGKDE
jgi:GT2 family glycosyltransferase